MALSFLPTFSPYTSVVYLHNGKPLFDEAFLQSDIALEKLTLDVSYYPDYVKAQTFNIPELKPGEPHCIRPYQHVYELERLNAITEEEPGQMCFTLTCGAQVLLEQKINFTWLPANAWVGDENMKHPELIAALVQPNDPVVDKILHQAGALLQKKNISPCWDGYKTPVDIIIKQFQALWHTIANYGINYVHPPQGRKNVESGFLQKIRTPSQIVQGGCATCLDSTMLMAAVFAQADFRPVVILIPGHAFIGVTLKKEPLASEIVTSISHLRNMHKLGELLVMETTLLTRNASEDAVDFETACRVAEKTLETAPSLSPGAFDIRQIWDNGITSINTKKAVSSAPAIELQEANADKFNFIHPHSIAELEEEQSLVTARKRTRMENWQLKLLDLSMRNNLLNCKIDSSQQELIIPDIAKLEDDLSNGSIFRISGLQVNFAVVEAEKKDDENNALRINISEQAANLYKRGELLAYSISKPLLGEQLEKRIYKLYLAARKNLEESGYNTLYIACGFLKWVRRDKGQQTLHAPLLLIPVRLTRKSVKSGFRLQTTDEEPRINLTLLELLKTEYDLRIPALEGELPTDKAGLDIAAIFSTVRRAIKDFDGWEVEEKCSIGIFSFAKYLMWKDLCDRQKELLTNPIVKHLAAEQREAFPAQVGFPNPAELNNEAEASKVFTPLSSDSSQLSAILAAGRGKNFVLIGPPGTGKSQTISNMIAHCLGHGKTVLFVAEKSAALSVVYSRLKRIGLGDFCLELHSNKAVKKEVLAQFKTALDSSALPVGKSNWEQAVSNLLQVRFGLNLMPWELHRHYPDGTSLYADICRLLETPTLAEFTPCEDKLLSLTAERKEEMLSHVGNLTMRYKAVAKLYPGVAENICTTNYSSVWEEQLASALSQYAHLAELWDERFERLCVELKLDAREHRGNAESLLRLLGIAEETTGQDNTPLLPGTASAALDRLAQALTQAENYRRCKAELTLPYPNGIEDAPDIPALYREWKMAQLSNFISRFFATRRIRKTLQMHAFSRSKPDIRKDLEALLDMKTAKEADIHRMPELAHFRKGVQMQPTELEQARRIAATLSELRGVQPLAKRYLTIAGNPVQKGSEAAFLLDEIQETTKSKAEVAAEISRLLGSPLPALTDNARGAARKWVESLLEIRHSWRLVTIWNECAAAARSKGFAAIVTQLTSSRVAPEMLEQAVLCNLSRCRLRAAVDASRTLTQFNAPTHEELISDYRQKDADLLTTAGVHLQQLLRKQALGVNEYGKEMAELQHELGKQRAHKAIRRLLGLTPNVSRLLKPCMLMSPLSVAQYLTPEAEPFDVVIFDEASQIPVWDAIGAIGRGKSAVIVGDPRQMPPTSFFSRGKGNETEEEEEIEVDLESILDECLACGIPQMNLTWHYRSKSESLIAFSNRNYYENKLVTFPAPVAKDTALQYHYVQGTYERGSSKRYNKKEAQALVDNVLAELRRPGFGYNELTSIGIVTFNTQQQALILDMFEKARAEDESLEPYFDEENPEAIFVKNLENVQGDERGVIYFSTTYGPDEKGAISMNFGPLNQTGGERRLNVAITRARTGMRVFTSLKPEDIDLKRTRARGAEDLRGFLECARMGANAYFNNGTATGSAAESGLQQSVCATLQSLGWQCICNLGVSGFRVDIAIAHPKQPGNMLAGIVLDGPAYATAATARDRDILRESVLHSLGWNILHIWALDWWRNPQAYAERICEQLHRFFNTTSV